MKKADAIVQSFLLLLTLISLLLSITMDRGFGYCIFYLQLIITLWQIVSAMEMIGGHEKYPYRHFKKAKIYMISFFVYLLGFAFVCGKGRDLLPVTWFFSGWLPVLFYAVFTLQVAFAKTPKRKTFMDIIN
ncbi:MAG: hypothetical protein JWP12_2315 [Bacteroidetes bacterium]|nr:hypothetical protein [Bacteroidota bacterium]